MALEVYLLTQQRLERTLPYKDNKNTFKTKLFNLKYLEFYISILNM